MILFLTSSPGGSECVDGEWRPAPFSEENGFLEKLRKAVPGEVRCLLICSDPMNFGMNEEMSGFYREALKNSGIRLMEMDYCDARTAYEVMQHWDDYNLIILSGGHVPTENCFFEDLNLRKKIAGYEGVVIGVSAGTMNCAKVVYAAPEEEGEAVDPDYPRYIGGLGLTGISVLPHFQEIRHWSLDGMRIYEDILLPDSKIRPFYGLPDGSYFYKDGIKTLLCGEAWYLKNGSCTKICENGQELEVEDEEI